MRWLFSTNHKDIGTLYFIVGVWSGFLGARISLIIRTEVGIVGRIILDEQIYNSMVTAHAFLIIFFLLYLLLLVVLVIDYYL